MFGPVVYPKKNSSELYCKEARYAFFTLLCVVLVIFRCLVLWVCAIVRVALLGGIQELKEMMSWWMSRRKKGMGWRDDGKERWVMAGDGMN